MRMLISKNSEENAFVSVWLTEDVSASKLKNFTPHGERKRYRREGLN